MWPELRDRMGKKNATMYQLSVPATANVELVGIRSFEKSEKGLSLSMRYATYLHNFFRL